MYSFPLTRQQQALRQAILNSKQTIDRETKSERELLLKGSKSAIELSEIRRRGAGQGNDSEYMLNTSKEHNESLSRTLKLMQQEVERTAHSAKVIGKTDLMPQRLSLSMTNAYLQYKIVDMFTIFIDESSKTLKATVGEYHTYDEVLKRGKGLITKLNQADWTDRLLIGFGLLVFSLVVMYILKKRIADRGISLVGYLFMPLRWFFSLLMPSLRATPPSPEAASEISGVIVEKAAAAGTPLVKAAASAASQQASAAPTSAVQGILGILDKIVGE